MTTIFALYLWTTVGFRTSHPATTSTRQDWRHIGDFASEQHCKEAARQLGIKTDVYRCVNTGRKHETDSRK